MLRRLGHILTITFFAVLAALSAAPAFAQQLPEKEADCTWKSVSKEKVAEANAALILTTAQRANSVLAHLPHGIPTAPAGADKEMLLYAQGRIANYDVDLLHVRWSAYRLRGNEIVSSERKEAFRSDPRLIVARRSLCADYKEEIFDRGHMAPNAAFARGQNIVPMLNTYLMSNMAPQYGCFNRGTWQKLEAVVRKMAEKFDEIHVITGAAFDRDGNGRDPDSMAWRMKSDTLDMRRVGIASHFFKIILYKDAGNLTALSLFMEHVPDKILGADSREYLRERIASIDEIEAVTGIRYFPDMEASIEGPLTAFKATDFPTGITISTSNFLINQCKPNLPLK